MSPRSLFQVQILEKLGAPLLLAVADVIARENKTGQDSQKQEAEQVASLLNKSVQASVGLASSLDIKDSEQQADAVRLALAGVVGRLVAGQYRVSGKVPGDNDIGKLVKALEAVLTFSDNFAPAGENTARLENIEPGMVVEDESQMGVQLVYALVPVVNSIATFPFGRPENKLVQEVSDQLLKKAKTICDSILGEGPAGVKNKAELKILESLAQIYAECHSEETSRLMAMNEADRAKLTESSGGMLPMERVWQLFDVRAGMAEIVGKSAVPASGGSAPAPSPVSNETSPVLDVSNAPSQEQAEQQPQMPPAPPPSEPAPHSDVASETPQSDEQENDGSYNPMGFFKPGVQKPNENEDGEGI